MSKGFLRGSGCYVVKHDFSWSCTNLSQIGQPLFVFRVNAAIDHKRSDLIKRSSARDYIAIKGTLRMTLRDFISSRNDCALQIG